MKPIANMKSNRRRSPFPSKKDNERTDNGGGSSSPGTSSFRIAPIPRADCSSNEKLFLIYTGESYLDSLPESLHITESLRIERMSGLISRPHSRIRAVNKCGDTLCFYCVKMEAGGHLVSGSG